MHPIELDLGLESFFHGLNRPASSGFRFSLLLLGNNATVPFCKDAIAFSDCVRGCAAFGNCQSGGQLSCRPEW